MKITVKYIAQEEKGKMFVFFNQFERTRERSLKFGAWQNIKRFWER